MSTIAENQLAHPNWYADPETVHAAVKQFLAWQGAQPGVFHPTIADDWESAGTGPFYLANVQRATEALEQHYRGVEACKMTGQEPVEAPWESWGVVQPTTGIEASEGGAVFGGS